VRTLQIADLHEKLSMPDKYPKKTKFTHGDDHLYELIKYNLND